MPTYDYLCLSCEHRFEIMQTMAAKPLKKCPECGKKVQRLLGSGAGLIFKGSGFYETDYKKKPPQTSEKTPPSNHSAKSENSSKTAAS